MNRISISHLYNHVSDIIEIKIQASNLKFSGEIEVYTYIEDMFIFARQLEKYQGNTEIIPVLEIGSDNISSLNHLIIKVIPLEITGLSSILISMNNRKQGSAYGYASFHLEGYPETINNIGKNLKNWTKNPNNQFVFEWKIF